MACAIRSTTSSFLRGFAMEISPAYVDVAVERWQCPATPLMKVRDIAGGDFGGSGSRA